MSLITAFHQVALGDCCKIVSGSTPSRIVPVYWNGNINWFTPKDLSGIKSKYVSEAPEKITQLGLESCSTTILPPKSLLLSSRAPIGHLAINLLPTCTNQGFKSLIPNSKLEIEYLYYAIKNIVPQLQDMGNGATFKEISKAILSKVKIPLPPLAEQQKIAAILDAADNLRQKDQQLVERYTALSQSLFLEMFGDPVTNPMGWSIRKLKDICVKVTDGTHHSPDSVEKGIPYVTAKHVKDYGLDFEAKATYISQQDHNEIYKRCNPEFGDILYIKDGATTGIACINTFRTPISLLSSLALLKLNYSTINSYFLCYWLNNKCIKEKLIKEYMSGAAIQRYTLAKINMFALMLPPITLQNQFAERIQLIEAQKQQAQLSLAKSEALFNSLLQRAFTGELTAKLVA